MDKLKQIHIHREDQWYDCNVTNYRCAELITEDEQTAVRPDGRLYTWRQHIHQQSTYNTDEIERKSELSGPFSGKQAEIARCGER